MPREDLTPGDPTGEREAGGEVGGEGGGEVGGHAGFHGKLPAAGDFVSRGLAPVFAARWDSWAARHLAPREEFPAGGLRLRLASGRRTASGLVLPSQDAVGRRYPLAALIVLPTAPSPASVDLWCEGARPLLDAARGGTLGPDALWEGLEALPWPEGGPLADVAGPALLLWAAGQEPAAADPADPGPALDLAFSWRGPSSP